jgi:hypothetical protein
MIINETTLRKLCARVAAGDEDARRDFDRHVLPRVEAIVSRWLSRQGPDSAAEHSPRAGNSAEDLARLTGAVCARMIATAANGNRSHHHRQNTAPASPLPMGETLFVRTKRHTISQPVYGPA